MRASDARARPSEPAYSSDDDAIRRCQAGDTSGLESLVARYQADAVRLAYLLAGDQDLAGDIAQESFLLVWRSIQRFRLGEPFAPWFHRIVANTARQWRRSARRRREVSLDTLMTSDSVDPVGLAPGARLPSTDPVERAETVETRAALLAALDTLPAKQREAMALRYFLGYTDGQIASVLKCRLGAVQQRLHDGRANLRKAIGARYPWLLSLDALTPPSRA